MTSHRKQQILASRSLLVIFVVVAAFLAAFLGQVLITELSFSPTLLPENGIIIRQQSNDPSVLRKHAQAILEREQSAMVSLHERQDEGSIGTDGWIISNDGWVMYIKTASAMRFVRLNSGVFVAITKTVDDVATGLSFAKIEQSRLLPITIAQSFQEQSFDQLISISRDGLASAVAVAGLQLKPQNDQSFSSDKVHRFPILVNALSMVGPALYNDNEELVCLTSPNDGPATAACIPAEQIRAAISDVLRSGTIKRASLGINYQIITGEGSGARVLSVSGVAMKSGVRIGDTITAVDGTPLSDRLTLSDLVLRSQAGDKFELTITRRNQPLTMGVTLE